MHMPPEPLTPAAAHTVLNALLAETGALAERLSGVPLYAVGADGPWVESRSGGWGAGCWAGLWWLRARLSGDAADHVRARDLTTNLRTRLDDDTVYRSLLVWHGAQQGVNAGDDVCRTLLADGAQRLLDSYRPACRAFPLGCSMGGGDTGNAQLTVDSLDSLLALLASHPAGAAEARAHVDSLIQACLRTDGWLTPHAHWDGQAWRAQAQADVWPRGQAWAMLGLTRAAQLWGAPYLGLAQRACAAWFARWPHGQPEQPPAGVDASATAIAAVAMFRLAAMAPELACWCARARAQLAAIVRPAHFRRGRFYGACYATRPGQLERVQAPWASYFLAAALCHAAELAICPE